MTKHASRQWGYVGESYRDASGGQEDVIVICTDKGETVAVIHDLSYKDSLTNARLIAAAPDLLKALQDIVTYCECAPPQGDPRMLYELFHTAKAAIAKATEATDA